MKKIFVVAGELSGDKTAAWYLKKLKKKGVEFNVSAVGGSFLDSMGAKIYYRMERLNLVGVLEIIKKLRFVFKFLRRLANYISENAFDEVIVVDFPGFNLRLIKKLKKLAPNICITYLAPPQLWVWGSGRVKKIKKYCDKVIVLYPFEVEWYKQHGVEAQYLGNPVSENIEKFLRNKKEVRSKNSIAILPASREVELDKLFPVFAEVVKRFKRIYPSVKFVLPLAESFDVSRVEKKIRKLGLSQWGKDILIVKGEQKKLQALSECCLAISKPGTVSLELALLNVPSVIIYRTSWITYFLAKSLVKIDYMALPNVFSKKPLFKEFIQGDCKVGSIFDHLDYLYKDFLSGGASYAKVLEKTLNINKIFKLKE